MLGTLLLLPLDNPQQPQQHGCGLNVRYRLTGTLLMLLTTLIVLRGVELIDGALSGLFAGPPGITVIQNGWTDQTCWRKMNGEEGHRMNDAPMM